MLFKIDGIESSCEDYGQAVIYKGSVKYHPSMFFHDKHHVIDKGKVFPVCGNTYRMLNESKFKDHFKFIGTMNNHYGIFGGCGVSIPFDESVESSVETQCC